MALKILGTICIRARCIQYTVPVSQIAISNRYRIESKQGITLRYPQSQFLSALHPGILLTTERIYHTYGKSDHL